MDENGNICAVSFDEDTNTNILTPAIDILKALYEIAIETGSVGQESGRHSQEIPKKNKALHS